MPVDQLKKNASAVVEKEELGSVRHFVAAAKVLVKAEC